MDSEFFWKTYVGARTPREFLAHWHDCTVEDFVAAYVSQLPHFHGIVLGGTWKNTFSREEQPRRADVASGILGYLDLHREEWADLPAPPPAHDAPDHAEPAPAEEDAAPEADTAPGGDPSDSAESIASGGDPSDSAESTAPDEDTPDSAESIAPGGDPPDSAESIVDAPTRAQDEAPPA